MLYRTDWSNVVCLADLYRLYFPWLLMLYRTDWSNVVCLADCISPGCSCCTELIGVMWFVLLTVFPLVAHVVLN